MARATLAPGDRFGAYEVIELVGAGGMGEVYRARDTRLPRDVALKILPDHRRLDRHRQARFEREAQLLSSLNHPNIAMLHGLEEANGATALVMELVEGETLADMLPARGPRSAAGSEGRRGRPLPVRRALEIARQIADALESAHERGIIHRDLKPANVKVRPDGTVKVLDFGLAKVALDDDLPGDTTAETFSASASAGAIVGTAAYMAPEQARGGPVDRRADVWAFGCVLYELLTGRRAFQGETTTDTLAAVLAREPDFTALPAGVPPSIQSLLRRCLAKEPRERLRDIGDARLEIADALGAPPSADTRRTSGRRWPSAAALAVVAGGAAIATWTLTRPDPPSSTTITDVALALPEAPIVPDQPVPVQLSRDGSRLLYYSVLGMAVADLGGTGTASIGPDRLPDRLSDFGVGQVMSLSPEGRSIAYVSRGTLFRFPVSGGKAITLATDIGTEPTASWTENGFILLATEKGLFRVSEEPGGRLEPLPVEPLEAGEGIYYPVLLPDGRHVLCTIARGVRGIVPFTAARANDARIEVIDLRSGARKTLVNGGGLAHYLPSGHLVYLARGGLQARTFDLSRMEAGRDERQVLDDIAQFSVSANGTLLYLTRPRSQWSDLVWVNRRNAEEEALGVDPMQVVYPRLSPSGRRIAIVGDVRGNRDVFLWDIDARRRTDVTNDPTDNQVVAWLDDDRFAFSSSRFGAVNMFMQAVEGVGDPQRLLESANDQMPLAFDAAGRLLFGERSRTRSFDTFVLDLKTGIVEPLLSTPAVEANVTFSPDKTWIAYQSDESGRFEVYVQSYPRAATRKQISKSGGTQPLFARDGSELYFRDFFGAVWAVSAAPPDFGPPTKILDPRDYRGRGKTLQSRTYDIADDGRLLMVKQPRQDLVLVVNWIERLRQLVPGP